MGSAQTPIAPTDTAHIAICPGCERPLLLNHLPDDAPAMQCPRCGTIIRPVDINTYELVEGENA
jgi:uncharacterized paraquat-inducible protein A